MDAGGNGLGSSLADANGFWQPLDIEPFAGQIASYQIDTGDREEGPTEPLLYDIKFGYC